ncbi:MAG: hypothetical protein EZS28_041799 [Streblomastix strix]|nr:MAG: hypothetical protein EZS28_041799 [Streblomastix strix]
MQEILSQKRPIDGKPSELDQMRVNGQVIKPIDPSHYSQELIDLVSALRRVNPNERPTIRQILEADSSSKTTAHSVLASQEAAASIKDE